MLILTALSSTISNLVAIVCIPSHSLLRKQGFLLKSCRFYIYARKFVDSIKIRHGWFSILWLFQLFSRVWAIEFKLLLDEETIVRQKQVPSCTVICNRLLLRAYDSFGNYYHK